MGVETPYRSLSLVNSKVTREEEAHQQRPGEAWDFIAAPPGFPGVAPQ